MDEQKSQCEQVAIDEVHKPSPFISKILTDHWFYGCLSNVAWIVAFEIQIELKTLTGCVVLSTSISLGGTERHKLPQEDTLDTT